MNKDYVNSVTSPKLTENIKDHVVYAVKVEFSFILENIPLYLSQNASLENLLKLLVLMIDVINNSLQFAERNLLTY